MTFWIKVLELGLGESLILAQQAVQDDSIDRPQGLVPSACTAVDATRTISLPLTLMLPADQSIISVPSYAKSAMAHVVLETYRLGCETIHELSVSP